MPSRFYTIGTRLPGRSPLTDYLNEYVTEYSAVTREMWHDMTSPDFSTRFPKPGAYVTHVCNKHGLLKRTVNSIRYDVRGRMRSLMELKKTEMRQTEIRIGAMEDRITAIKAELDAMGPGAASNSLTDKELRKYRCLKQALYWKKNRLNRLKQRRKGLEYQIRNNVYSMCYGSKALFNKQHRLSENGYKTHEKWHADFVRARDKNIFCLGSADESFGNQMCRLRYDAARDGFVLDLRKEYKYCAGSGIRDKYVRTEGLDFKYMRDDLIRILRSYDTAGKGDHPLSYRFHREGGRWYLQVIFAQTFENYRTVSKYGTIGLDYNDGFIELSETDESGNLVYRKHYGLRHHGTGSRAEAEIRDVIADIAGYAENRCKDIVIEDLDFRRVKARQSASGRKAGRRYNRMLHIFDYHRYKQTLLNTGFNHRVNVVLIDPKNTSRIGKQKYGEYKKLNVHQAASFVIARRGQGYIDRLRA